MPKRIGRPRKMGRPSKNLARQRRWEQRNKDRHKVKKIIADAAKKLFEQGIIDMPKPVLKTEDTKPADTLPGEPSEQPAAELPTLGVDETKAVLQQIISMLQKDQEVPGFSIVPASRIEGNQTVESKLIDLEDGMALVKLKPVQATAE